MSSSDPTPTEDPPRDPSLPASTPDIVEQDEPEMIDNIVPTRGYHLMPLVGLGGSAGSIPALLRFFAHVPPNTGMAFVVIIHLSPEHESILPRMLQQATPMPVRSAEDRAKLQPDHVYVIPPGKHLTVTDGHLRLTDLLQERGRRVAVDLFLRTLADTHGPHSTAIILSGADSDGAIGIKRIKERGGLTIAQDPDEAEHSGMPRSAISTGMIDWVLKVDEIPKRVIDYYERERRLQLPPEEGPQPGAPPRSPAPADEQTLRDTLAFVRSRTGRDFSYYKRATILRRISRRMQVNGMEDLPGYLDYLRTHPGEPAALVQDLLISVTNFFRDRDAFAALQEQIPELFRGKGPSDTVRVWVAACATGEEAYSVAMLLHEHARSLDHPPAIQIFATDLDEEVVQAARDGVYPLTIATDVSEDRLRRFFIKEHRGYRVRRELRETVLFAVHDLLKDSPFSRLDLISCRNLLIYLSREAQNRAFEIFHFALLAQGRLFLGSSESVEDSSPLFGVVDKKYRLYAPRLAPRVGLPVPSGPGTLAMALEAQERARERPAVPPAPGALALPPRPDRKEPLAASWAELHFKLIERFAPPSILVNQEHEIVHLSASAGRFLQLSGGEPTRNLLRLVHPMMRIELRAALYRAAQSGARADAFHIPVEVEGSRRSVNLRVEPALDLAPDFFLVFFEVQDVPPREEGVVEVEVEPESLARQLERELEELKSHLRDVVEQSEASNEELKASNEELQAMNEELRSATEELETSREELQSINEELTTVNQELKSKVDELGHANSDLHNLMASTAIATVFLDRELRITRYTPSAVTLFNFIPTDVGRPLSDLARQRDYRQIQADAARALSHLTPAERELQIEGHWFLARTLPYRTTDDHIAGVVLTFIDITDLKRAQNELQSTRAQLETNVQQRTGQLDAANRALRAEVEQRGRMEDARHEMVRQLMAAQEKERARISRGLHDEVGQRLTALILDLKALEIAAPKPAQADKVKAMRGSAETLAREIHELAVELRPTALDDLGLLRALSNYVEGWASRTKVKVEFTQIGMEGTRLPTPVETTIYRIVGEALNNVTKHAKAKRVRVLLERGANDVSATVEDSGIGFDPGVASAVNQLGITGMKERAALLNGDVHITSSPGKGARVTVRIPLPVVEGKSV